MDQKTKDKIRKETKIRKLAKKFAEDKGLVGPFSYTIYEEGNINAGWVTVDSSISGAYVSAEICKLSKKGN